MRLVGNFVNITDSLCKNPGYRRPLVPSYSYYFQKHVTPTQDYCYDVWMSFSAPFCHLAKRLINALDIEEIIRIDGTFKCGKKGIVVDEHGKQLQSSDAKVLMVATNEINQWVSIFFSAAEDKHAYEELFERLKPLVKDETKLWVCCDNTTAYRNTILSAYPHAKVKQDPFHVVKRPSSSIMQSHRRISTKAMSDVLFDKSSQEPILRDHKCMIVKLNEYHKEYREYALKSKLNEFEGTLSNTRDVIHRLEMDLEGII